MSEVNKKLYKFFKTKAVSIDDANKTIKFRISDNKPDRMDEIVDQKSWDFESYLANPLVLWGHKSEEPEHVLGTGMDLETTDDGSETYATLKLDEDINPKASLVWKQLVKGTLRCVSVGFIAHNIDQTGDNPVLKDCELLEISIVPIPANPRAVALDFKTGAISKKDAKWLSDSMRKEAELIETQIKQEDEPAPKENKTMDEQTSKQISGLLDAVTKLAGAQADTNARLDSLATEMKADREEIKQKGAVADILSADDGWDVTEAKWQAMEDVAEIYYALCEAFFYTATPVADFQKLLTEAIGLWQEIADGTYNDGDETGIVGKAAQKLDSERVKLLTASLHQKAADEPKGPVDAAADTEPATDEAPAPKTDDEPTAEPAKKAADDPANKKTEEEPNPEEGDKDPDDPAKGGNTDQPGATDDEIDDDTELTPERQAQIDAELEAAFAQA